MSKSLVPRDPDQAQGIIDSVKHDGVTAGIVVAGIVAHAVVPVVGWAAFPVAGAILVIRAVRRGRRRNR